MARQLAAAAALASLQRMHEDMQTQYQQLPVHCRCGGIVAVRWLRGCGDDATTMLLLLAHTP
jgi:hypothetical protein